MKATPDLVAALAKLYKRKPSIDRVVRDLDLEAILTHHDRPIDTWSELFEGIVDMGTGKVIDLFDYIDREYPGNQMWQDVREQYLNEQRHRKSEQVVEVRPSVGLQASRPLTVTTTPPASWRPLATDLRKAIRNLERDLRRFSQDIERSGRVVALRLSALEDRIGDLQTALAAIRDQRGYSDEMSYDEELRLRQLAAAARKKLDAYSRTFPSDRLKEIQGDISREKLRAVHSTGSELTKHLWTVYQSIRQLLSSPTGRIAGQR